MAGSTTATKTVSHRRNIDYKKQFNWAYVLNKDLFDCYTKAREDPSKGYMKGLKNLWDTLHQNDNPNKLIIAKKSK